MKSDGLYFPSTNRFVEERPLSGSQASATGRSVGFSRRSLRASICATAAVREADVELGTSARPGASSTIVQFLRGRQLFVTGATGFLAKVLVEKILWEQPDVGMIHLLVQRRGDTTPEQRLQDLVDTCPLFERLRARHGEGYADFMRTKLTAVEGNLTQPGMGVEPAVLDRLRGLVQVVVNSAASTTFDERYDAAVSAGAGALCSRMARRNFTPTPRALRFRCD